MKKLEKFFWVLVSIAEVALVGVWAAGVNGNLELAAILFTFAGVFCMVALGCFVLQKLREHDGFY